MGDYFDNSSDGNFTSNFTSDHNDSHGDLHEDHGNGHGGGHHSNLPTPILFIFASCAVGALARTLLKFFPSLPYTVLLLIVGFLLGLLANIDDTVKEYTNLADLDPHTILHVFLPVLVFESAYAMDAHTFFKSFTQIALLAAPGLCFASFFTALFCLYVYDYGWGWSLSMMFGCLISATDPVAVVALLKELGASKRLSTLLEGESLLNDGAAIVLFEIFLIYATPGMDIGVGELLWICFRKMVLGPLFGYVMAQITIFWLVNIFNDALTEITITLCSTYITFYVGDGLLQLSGVIAVVMLGVIISANKTSISPEVETFLHRFWEMLAYLANTLIFILVGVVIATKAYDEATTEQYILIIALYLAITCSRALVVLIFTPLLSRIGYGITWQTSTVMIWGGLRGAVGLALALVVYNNHELDPTGRTQKAIILHTSGIVMLTLIINGTSIKQLLTLLGMNNVSIPKRLAMANAVKTLEMVVKTSKSVYKSDRFLADADWDMVEKYIQIKDPYETTEDEAKLAEITNFERTTTCPCCATEVQNEPSPVEFKEMRNEARLRLLKAEKVSYWKQFEHGMLSREGVRRLYEVVDYAIDTPDEIVVDTKEISNTWKIKGYLEHLKSWLEKKYPENFKTEEKALPEPKHKFRKVCFRICISKPFDILVYLVIIVNVTVLIVQVVNEYTLSDADFRNSFGSIFDYFNFVFIGLYTLEAAIKLIGLDKNYFRSKWNLFDFTVLILCYVDLFLELVLFYDLGQGQNDALLTPNLLRAARIVRLLRLLRTLRLFRLLIPSLKSGVDRLICKKLKFGFDVGKGYIMGEEEVQNFLDLMIDNKKIAAEFQVKLSESRAEVIKDLANLQKDHPGVAVSIKTQQAARRILNDIQDKVLEMKGEGVLDDTESARLITMIEIRIKQLLTIPPSLLPPKAEKVIRNLPWVQDNEELTRYILNNSTVVNLSESDELTVGMDPRDGMYIVISGLVKVVKEKLIFSSFSIDETNEDTLGDANLFVTDFVSTGSLFGSYAILTGKSNKSVITGETPSQIFHITTEAVEKAIEDFSNISLENLLWKVSSITIASYILKHLPQYFTWSSERFKIHVAKGFVEIEKLEDNEPLEFIIAGTYDDCDVVLVHGLTKDPASLRIYSGPCYIPSKVGQLTLMPDMTDKHVIFILPRDHLSEDAHILGDKIYADAHHQAPKPLNDRFRIRSSRISAGGTSRRGSRQSLCLNHAAKERESLMSKINGKMKLESKASVRKIMDKYFERARSTSAKQDEESRVLSTATFSTALSEAQQEQNKFNDKQPKKQSLLSFFKTKSSTIDTEARTAQDVESKAGASQLKDNNTKPKSAANQRKKSLDNQSEAKGILKSDNESKGGIPQAKDNATSSSEPQKQKSGTYQNYDDASSSKGSHI